MGTDGIVMPNNNPRDNFAYTHLNDIKDIFLPNSLDAPALEFNVLNL